MARRWIFAAITGTWLFSAGATYACGVAPPPTRPVQQVQQVGWRVQANEMNTRANELDGQAQSHEATAASLDVESDRLVNRARVLRNQAELVNVADRESINDIASELVERASVLRTRASTSRAQAADLRLQARTLRNRAIELARVNSGGGGWGGPRRGVVL